MKKGLVLGILASVWNVIAGFIFYGLAQLILTHNPDAQQAATAQMGLIIGYAYFGIAALNLVFAIVSKKSKVGGVFLIIIGILSALVGLGAPATIMNIIGGVASKNAHNAAKAAQQPVNVELVEEPVVEAETVEEPVFAEETAE
ncbi:MAG: hypothetical protein IKC47_02695 [Clostridia bacterium]|nr:hypothetical protein [Clostridia bacterium]